MAVLHVLRKELSPISLGEIQDKLHQDFKERSLRRWLDSLINDGIVQKTGQKRATKYQLIQSENERHVCFEPDSLNAIEYLHKPIYERTPTSYDETWLHSYILNSSFFLSENKRKQLHKEGSRAGNKDPAGTYAHQILNRLLIDLSYNSSRLEGNTYSLLDTQRLILSGMSPEGKLDEEKVMILNHKEAIRYLVENASKLRCSLQTTCTLHYLLADGLVEAKYAGKVRDHGVRISGSTYIPLEDPKVLQQQLEKISTTANEISDPFEQSLFLLTHISYLQAFSDVNKRTARLCANIPFVIQNVSPLSFNDIKRDDYMSATIALYELRDARPMADLFYFSYLRTCAAYDATIHALGYDEVRVRYRQQRRAIIREIISKQIVGQPMDFYISSETKQGIPPTFQKAFIEDISEDLAQIDQNYIAGLGITPEQLESWKRRRIQYDEKLSP